MARRFIGHWWAIMLVCAVVPAVRASERSLSPFDVVHLCVPFNVQIQPGNDYRLNIEGDGVLDSAITADVTDGVLSLGTNAFSTSNPIKVTVSLPGGELKGITQSGLQASAFVASGFYGDDLTISSSFGTGRVDVDGANYTNVHITNSGTGIVRLNGAFSVVDIATNGITNTYLSGDIGTASLRLTGISNVYIVASMPSLRVTGSASGIPAVLYNQGQCSVSSDFPMRDACQKNPSLSFEVPSGPVWTSQLSASGTFVCMGAPAGAPTQATPAPAPVPPEQQGNSYNFATPTPGGYQAQSGSAGPSGTTASSNAQGTNSASASSVAGPSGASTQTSNDGTTNSATTAG